MSLTVQSQDFVKEFNFIILNYLKCNTIETEQQLNGKLTMILASDDNDLCNSDLPPIWTFYYNLYKLISVAETNTQIFWSAVSILNKVVKLDASRTNILRTIDFVPILSNHLSSITSLEKKVSLLFLLKELTYGIEIHWEKPYLDTFVTTLLNYILSNDESDNIVVLALTILVNLCHRNIQPTFLLLTKIPTLANFMTRIKPHQLLSAKMYVILGEHNYCIKPTDFDNLIKLILIDIEKAVNSLEVGLLQHSVEFLKDLKQDGMISADYIQVDTFRSYIANLLKITDNVLNLNSDNSNSCKSIILELFSVITMLDGIVNEFPKMLEFALKCLKIEKCIENALNLIQNISKKIRFDASHQTVLSTIDEVIRETIELSATEQYSCVNKISLFRVLSVLISNANLQCGILTLASVTFFDKIFKSLVSIEPENLKFAQISQNDVRMYIHALNLLSRFSEIASLKYLGSTVILLKKPQIHFILAKGMYSGDEEMINIIFYLSSKNEFLHEQIAHIMQQLNCNTNKKIHKNATLPPPSANVMSANRDERVNLINNYYVFKKQIEKRLNDLIDYFNNKINSGEMNDLNLTEVIQFHQHKIYMLQAQIDNQSKQLHLVQANEAQFEYVIGYQKSEISHYQQENFAMHLAREKTQMELEVVRNERDSYKTAYQTLQTKLETQKREYERVMSIQINEYKFKLANWEEKYKSVETQNQDFRKELLEARENLPKLEEAKMDNLKLSKDIAQMKIERANLIRELSEKTSTIETLEREIREVEDMRQTIMSLMSTKKPLTKR